MREDDIARLFALSWSCVIADQLKVEVTCDLSVFEAEMATIGKKPNYPMISSRYHDFNSDDAFGLLVRDANKKLVAGVAARRVELGGDTLRQHWEASYSRFYPGAGKPIAVGVSHADTITGRIVYLGELYIERSHRKGQINTPALMHYLHSLSALKWRPNWLYGFIRLDGLQQIPGYGFAHQHIGAQNWLRPVEGRGDDEFLVSVSYDELGERATYLLENPGVLKSAKVGNSRKQ